MDHQSSKISVVILTHNSASRLERCLESVRWASEILIIDSGSTDETLELARRFKCQVFFHPSQDADVLWQFGVAQAQADWVLRLQPDEWVAEMLRHEIDGVLLQPAPHVHAFAIPRQFHLRGKARRGLSPTATPRLFRRTGEVAGKGSWGEILAEPTEKNPPGVVKLDNPLGYEPYDNYHDLVVGMNQEATQAAYRLLEAGQVGRGWGLWLLLALRDFLRAYVVERSLLDGMGGFFIALTCGYHTFLKHLKVRELILGLKA